ncbi:NADH:flavin oxidoreductase [Actinosynnema pretiosum]|uniref:12-oxophytodienoate reductase n=1 Tax=Actinosynnema pretiosum TaxID=42197 RepID=A0A290Z5T9_9PSEU|nr:NADH:flavin oxidoreductase [Actinosynnema pretiosum]ATE54421.1 12-oxophytodienoate reductase [Actinosynnema pretiosum]
MSTSSAERAATLLSRPFTVGSLTVPGRVAMAPMTRAFSPDGTPGADVASYYARRAAGGVGLIVTEGTYVNHRSAGLSDRIPRFHGEAQLAGWANVVEQVHAAGGTIVPQLWHVGMARPAGAPPNPDAPSIGPSGVGIGGTADGDTMTQRDIDDVVAAFATAAADAERIGFDGIELHGAHGYLIDQFLWAGTNRRTDAYGGDPVARTRFAAEVVAAVRAAVSPDFPLILRMSQWKMGDYAARIADTPQELEAILAPLAAAGVDVFHASTRRYWDPEFDGEGDLNLAGWIKKLTGKATISVGSVGLDADVSKFFGGDPSAARTDVDALLDRLERDEFDLIAVGRALLADPEWVAKVVSGRADEITPFTKDAATTLV